MQVPNIDDDKVRQACSVWRCIAAMSVSALHDSSSAAYKKAQRLHQKTTKNRSTAVESEWTPFRAAEKFYKARFPPPNLSNVLDLATLDDSRSSEIEAGYWLGRAEAVEYAELPLKNASDARKAYAIPAIPGMFASACRSMVNKFLKD